MKKSLLKTMLVAIGMAAGTMGAGADTYNILYGIPQYDTDGTTILSVSPQTDFAGDPNEQTGVVFSDANGEACAAAMPIDGSVIYTQKTAWTKDFAEPVVSGKVIYSANYTVSANNSNTFQIVDSKGYAIYASSEQTTNGNSEQAVATICGEKITNWVRQARKCAYGVKSLCIDLDTRKVSYELLVSSGNNSYSTLTGTVDLPAEVTDVKGLSAQKTSYGAYLDNVCLYNQISEETQYKYVLNYKLGDEVIATSSANVPAGTEVKAQNIIYSENNDKYFLDNEEYTFIITSDGNNVFDVNVRKAITATLSVKTNVNGEVVKTDVTNLIEADDNTTNWSYYYPLYVEKDGVYYICDNTETFGESGTFTNGEEIEKTVSYSVANKDVLNFVEAEDNCEEKLISDYNTAYSNGRTGARQAENYTNRGMSVGTYPAGNYEMVVLVTDNPTRQVVLRDASSTDPEENLIALVDKTGLQTVPFTLTKETELLVNGKNTEKDGVVSDKSNQSADFDYIIIRKVQTSVTTSITSAGWATLYSDKALDFTGTGVKAYIGTVNGSSLTLTEVTNVPAETAVIIEGEEGPYDIPVIESSETNVAANVLKGTLEEITLKNEAEYDYYAMKVLSNGNVGFALVADGGTVIPAGKAYLQLHATTEAAKVQFFSLGGETTGIEAVETQAKEDGKYYNLMGVEVENPQKGIYIKNGKKIVIK